VVGQQGTLGKPNQDPKGRKACSVSSILQNHVLVSSIVQGHFNLLGGKIVTGHDITSWNQASTRNEASYLIGDSCGASVIRTTDEPVSTRSAKIL
jgi:hypothetical protein